MRYNEFERIMTSARMSRYLVACNYDTRKAVNPCQFTKIKDIKNQPYSLSCKVGFMEYN